MMTLQKYRQHRTRYHNRFQLERIQFRIISGPVLYQHRMNDKCLRGYEEDFHYKVVELD